MSIFKKTLIGLGISAILATGASAQTLSGEVSATAKKQADELSTRVRLNAFYNDPHIFVGGIYDFDLSSVDKGYGLVSARYKLPKGLQVGLADSIVGGSHATGLGIAYTWNKGTRGFVQPMIPFDGSDVLAHGKIVFPLDKIGLEKANITFFAKANLDQQKLLGSEVIYRHGPIYARVGNLGTGRETDYELGVRIPFKHIKP
ncbi:hypothetical protein GOV10_05590 [Candidatus Woesearchaeota archaeon]|nr:hypothetical protein [Candidatus Woesearchaeota archaeon]